MRDSMPGLEVVSPRQPGLEPVRHKQPGLEPVSQVAVYPARGPKYDGFYSQYEGKTTPRVCGLKRTTFWILVAAAVVIITAGGLGGGLGGWLSQRSQNSRQQQTTTQSQTQTQQTQTQTAQTQTQTQHVMQTVQTQNITAIVGTVSGVTKTLYRDCPSSNDTDYYVQFDNSTTYAFRKLCNMQAWLSAVDTDYVNQQVGTLNDCINLCAAWNENNVTAANSDQVCSSVCWRNTFDNDEYPGQCFGYNGNNASVAGGFHLEYDANCDAAIWTNQ